MGETPNQPFQLSFNPALKVEFQGSRVTSDGCLILVRELDQRLGLRSGPRTEKLGWPFLTEGTPASKCKFPMTSEPRPM